jgi:hypothetical protein
VKIYVAGRTTDVHTVQGIAESLEDEGHEITFKWFDPEVGEIRHGSIRSEDLELIEENVDSSDVTGSTGTWSSTVRHKPSGMTARGHGSSKLASHDVAVNMLRGQLNAGWSNNPERAQEIATSEMQAVNNADATVLVWAPDLLGAAIETGAMLFKMFITNNENYRLFVYRPGRDSVFWYMANVHVVWTKPDLLEMLRESTTSIEDEFHPLGGSHYGVGRCSCYAGPGTDPACPVHP